MEFRKKPNSSLALEVLPDLDDKGGMNTTPPKLFVNESFFRHGSFQFLSYFRLGSPKRPLMIFFPGWGHLARISYGGANIPSKEFLAEAFLEKGYSFLALSYPLENPVFTDVYPQLMMQDWAEAAAALADRLCKKHGLPSVIALHWSAAGQLISPFYRATHKMGVNHLLSLALEATPSIILSMEKQKVTEFQTNGMVGIRELYPHWHSQLSAMLGAEIDNELYQKDFLGSFPACLLGTTHCFSKGKLEENLDICIRDRSVFDFEMNPFVASICGTDKRDPYHPLVDGATWGFINQRKIYQSLLAPYTKEIALLSNEEWKNLLHLIQTFNQNMSYSIEGNHFFFVGQQRAREIVHITEKTIHHLSHFYDVYHHIFKTVT